MEIYIDIELHCQYTTAPPSEIIIIVYDGGSWIGTMSSLLVRHLINLFLFLSRFSLLFFFFFWPLWVDRFTSNWFNILDVTLHHHPLYPGSEERRLKWRRSDAVFWSNHRSQTLLGPTCWCGSYEGPTAQFLTLIKQNPYYFFLLILSSHQQYSVLLYLPDYFLVEPLFPFM